MQALEVDNSQDLVTSDVLLTLQFCTGNEPLLPRLESFASMNTTRDFIPFIPLFLSQKTIDIHINFAFIPPTVTVALTIARFPTLCPHIQYLLLDPLPKDSAMTEAVSEMVLAFNRDTLRGFYVACPLTEEAYGVLCTLPNLHDLWVVIQGPISLPPVALPNLGMIYVEYDSGRDWLQGFRGATLGKLRTVIFCPTPGSAQIGGFLEEFQSIALATSAQNSLVQFSFRISQSWTPDYSSLLVFKQMEKLEIGFSCNNGCSSTVDDDIIISLAQVMPELEILQLGNEPCRALGGVTFKGLIALALHCPRLSKLCVHFQPNSLVEATSPTEPPPPSGRAAAIPRTNCALIDLQVGKTPIQESATLAVSLTLLQIFPGLVNIEYVNPRSNWKSVAETIKLFRRISVHVDHASKTHLPHLQ